MPFLIFNQSIHFSYSNFILSTTCMAFFSQEGKPEQRNWDDKEALAAKVAKKAAMKKEEEEAALQATTHKSVVKKKISKPVNNNLDDLLSAGLKKTKKK